MRKGRLTPKTIDDEIMKDMLRAVGTLEGREETKDKYLLVGGVGVQSYLPSVCRRPTADIDLAVFRPLNYEDFKGFSRTIVEYLGDNGYQVRTRKNSRNYAIEVDCENDGCVIEFARMNESNFKRMEKLLEREFYNARSKLVEGEDITYKVCSPEDLVTPKLMRTIHTIMRSPYLISSLPKRKNLDGEIIFQRLERIKKLRAEVMRNPFDELAVEELKLVSDSYDIKILSEITGFNIPYLNESARDWDTISMPSKERDIVIEKLLPSIKIGRGVISHSDRFLSE